MPVLQRHRERVDQQHDASGFTIFSAGEAGYAHLIAHRMLDQSRPGEGYLRLGAWLAGRRGVGREWVHLQWHMAVFELALGRWSDAFSRFHQHILPVAAASEDALTDAPALLWRLALASREPVTLPWGPVRATALARMQRPSRPYAELHNLLALAGAGDVTSLDRWLQTAKPVVHSQGEMLVARMAMALRAYVTGNYEQSTDILATVVPRIAEIGGSRAQNHLFQQLEMSSREKASARVSMLPFQLAA